MKVIFFSLIILILCAVICLIFSFWAANETLAIADLATKCADLINQENFSEAKSLLYSIDIAWKEIEYVFSMTTPHDELSDISSSIVRCLAFLEKEDGEEAFSEMTALDRGLCR